MGRVWNTQTAKIVLFRLHVRLNEPTVSFSFSKKQVVKRNEQISFGAADWCIISLRTSLATYFELAPHPALHATTRDVCPPPAPLIKSCFVFGNHRYLRCVFCARGGRVFFLSFCFRTCSGNMYVKRSPLVFQLVIFPNADV